MYRIAERVKLYLDFRGLFEDPLGLSAQRAVLPKSRIGPSVVAGRLRIEAAYPR
jgi:hypothetical protein